MPRRYGYRPSTLPEPYIEAGVKPGDVIKGYGGGTATVLDPESKVVQDYMAQVGSDYVFVQDQGFPVNGYPADIIKKQDDLNTPFGSYQKYTANSCTELATHTYVTGRAFETCAVGIEISEHAMAQRDTNVIGIIGETCVTPEPVYNPEPYKRRALGSHKREFEVSGMLDEFMKHYRGDYDG